MQALVLQLQAAALDPAIAMSDLLRMAVTTAAKLGVSEIEEWLRHELDGYGTEVPLPEYRKVHGEPQAQNPYRGWLPLQFNDAETQERYSIGFVREPISTIESLVKDSEVIGFKYPAKIDVNLRKAMNYDVPVLLHVLSPAVKSILDAVRNRVLDWSLKLEKAGVLGDEMTFSRKEREQAHTINITGNVGVIGDLVGHANVAASICSVSQSTINVKEVVDAVDALKRYIGVLPEEAEHEVRRLEAEAKADKPKQSRLRSGLTKIGEAATQIGDKVVQAGVKALVDRALDG